MPNDNFNEAFSRRLRFYLNKYDMTQIELAKRLGVGKSTVSDWANGRKVPRADTVDRMCDIFHCRRSDLVEAHDNDEPSYYTDQDAMNAAEFLHSNPQYKVLFDATRKVKPEDIEIVRQLLDRFGGDDD